MAHPAAQTPLHPLNDRRFVLTGIPVLALLVLIPRGLLHVRSWQEVVVAWLFSLVFTTAFWLSGRALWLGLFRRMPRVEQTGRRLWWLAGTNTLTAMLVTLGLGSLAAWAQGGHLDASTFWFEFGLNMVPTVMVQLIYESRHFFQQWEQNVRRAEQLQSAGVQSQLEALQSQLDPHFLFNSLNTLSALVEPENEPAQRFVEQLSDVYRYVLLARERTTVLLSEELAFVDTYLALHKVRFRDNLRVTQHVPPEALGQLVAPLSIQLLVENALKHNVASREHPLELHLTADLTAHYIVVENTLRPRTAGLAPGTGTGLRNVRHRYELLGALLPVVVSAANGVFQVKLPLLPAR
ncbi:histidine kinase [Hymenobacter taeanensis]|uniref:Histidine kinase n=1 Tax=Hymenobacter taeanensis TaxID=2735321 RepID=A0A6M6BB72_9BACT|nr:MULTISPECIES: histidine kinase [Hymenobacter]QJX45526.1 histidine kinase [Hymenobacter taeanensis]UOQ81226.1 histidine kinase [Hymenobacter sp. 5414T-23]